MAPARPARAAGKTALAQEASPGVAGGRASAATTTAARSSAVIPTTAVAGRVHAAAMRAQAAPLALSAAMAVRVRAESPTMSPTTRCTQCLAVSSTGTLVWGRGARLNDDGDRRKLLDVMMQGEVNTARRVFGSTKPG
jgi:hypothetical protein